MAKKLSKKKSFMSLTKDVILKNYGDVVGMVFLLLVAGSMFGSTSRFFLPLVKLHYSKNVSGEDQPWIFGKGKWDWAPVFTYSLLCVLFTCVKFIPRLQLSQKKAWELRWTIVYSIFHVFVLVTGILFWKEHFNSRNMDLYTVMSHFRKAWNDFPFTFINVQLKLLYTIGLSFPICMVSNLYFLQVKTKFYPAALLHTSLLFGWCWLLWTLNFGTIGLHLLMGYSVPTLVHSLSSVAFMMNLASETRMMFSAIHTLVTVGSVLQSLAIMYAATVRGSLIHGISPEAFGIMVGTTLIATSITVKNLIIGSLAPWCTRAQIIRPAKSTKKSQTKNKAKKATPKKRSTPIAN